MIQAEHIPSRIADNLVDWAITAILLIWGWIVSVLTAPDWVTVLTITLLLTKIAHEAFRFFQSWRRSRLKRRAADRLRKK